MIHIKKKREDKKTKSDLKNNRAKSLNNRDNHLSVDAKEKENDAIQALIVLGFSEREAQHRVNKVLIEWDDISLEELIYHSLR